MLVYFSKVAVITDVVAGPVLVNIGVLLRLASNTLCNFKCLEYRAGILGSASEVINLCTTRGFIELVHECDHIGGVNVVPYLFSLIAINPVFPAFEIALHEIAQEPMKLHSAVIWAGQTPSSQTTGWHRK